MKKINRLILFVICFFCFSYVKADVDVCTENHDDLHTYCQYIIDRDGSYHVVGDCNIKLYFSYSGDFLAAGQTYYNYIPSICYGSTINGTFYENSQATGNISSTQYINNNVIGNELKNFAVSNGNVYFPNQNNQTFIFNGLGPILTEGHETATYYCKVGSQSWCKKPTEASNQYYSIIFSGDINYKWNCGYTDYLSEDGFLGTDIFIYEIICDISKGCTLTNYETNEEVTVGVEKFLLNGKPYCPRINVSSKPLITDEGTNHLFEKIVGSSNDDSPGQSGSSTRMAYCSYNLSDSKGKYFFEIIKTYDANSKVSINTRINKCCNIGVDCDKYIEILNDESGNTDSVLANYYNNFYSTSKDKCPEVKISGQSLKIDTTNMPFTESNAIGAPNFSCTTIPLPGAPSDKYDGLNTCSDIDVNKIKACGCIPAAVADITSKAYFILRIVGPILLLILGGFEMAKAIASQDESSIEKAKKKLVNKFIAAAAIFLILTIMELVVNLLAKNSAGILKCIHILLDGYVI